MSETTIEDTFDENASNVDDDFEIPEKIYEQLKTKEEIGQGLHHSKIIEPDQLFERDNLIYLPIHWLYEGPKALKVAQAVIIRRHRDKSLKGIYICVEFWYSFKQSTLFEKKKSIYLYHQEFRKLFTYMQQALASFNEVETVPVQLRAAETLDNLDETQRQTFANILNDVALTRRVSELYNYGQLTIETIDHLAAATQQIKYKAALADLREMIEGERNKVTGKGKTKSLDEHDFQHWFEEHPWVFGTEYIQRINIRQIDTHATVDFVLLTADGFLDVLELKTPDADVLNLDKKHNTWYFASDVAKVIAQGAKYIDAIERSGEKIYRHSQGQILFVRPRVRVVIGRSNKWTPNQHEAFRRLSATLHYIDIMTFDHVVIRAEQLIAHYDHPSVLETISIDESTETDN